MPRSPSPERNQPRARRRGGVVPRRRSPSPPPPLPQRSLRPRRAAAVSSRPLVDDFFPFLSSPSLSPPRPQNRRPPSLEPSSSHSGSGGASSSAADRRRRKLKLVVKLSQLPPDQQHRRAPPPLSYSGSSDGEELPCDDASGGEEQIKPPKKRRIELVGNRSRHHQVAGRNDSLSAPRTRRLPVPGTGRTTPLPDREALDMILDKLQKKDTYGVFAEPVDVDELPDYHDVIEHPMDFGTVKRKLARNAYPSFEQFEDDVFLICSNAMLYNAPDTIYFRQAHTIHELARKNFQELRNEGIPTVKQIKSEQKVRPNSYNREPIKKPIMRYSEDDLEFLIRKEQIKKPDSKNSVDSKSFKGQVKKSIHRNSEDDLSSSFHKERVKKPVFSNSEDDLSSSFHRERVWKSVSRNAVDGRSSSSHQVQVKNDISRSLENDCSSSFHKQQEKMTTSWSSKDDLSQKKQIRKPVSTYGEDPDRSSYKEPVENPTYTKGDDIGVSPKMLAAKLSSRYRDDLSHSRQKESVMQPISRDRQDNLGYSCNEETVRKPTSIRQDALGSDVSPATIVFAGDGSNGLSMSEANVAEAPDCTAANGFSEDMSSPVSDIRSPVDEIRSEKTDDISASDYSANPTHKPFVVDETRRKTYDASSEEQAASVSDPIFDVFSGEPKELISVGVLMEHSYARSLARFAGSLGTQGWRIASECIRQVLPAEVNFGCGWVGEYEPPLPPEQSRSLISSEANIQRNASLRRDNGRLRSTDSVNANDKSLSLLNQISTVDSVVGVSDSLESPEFKPKLLGVTVEPQLGNTESLSKLGNHRVSGSVGKTKRTNAHMRKDRSSSSAHPSEMQPQRSECSKGASSGIVDMPAVNKMAGQPRPFFQPPEAVRTQQISKSDSSKSNHTRKMAPQGLECPKIAPVVHDMLPTNNGNGQPKLFFQSHEAAAVPQPKNEATWVYRGQPGDRKSGISEKSRPMSSIGFITKNPPVKSSSFAMNASSQKDVNDHAKSMGSTVTPGQANVPNRGSDVSRNVFLAFPASVRENQSIPSAPVAQSWISFGASSDSTATNVSPTLHDSYSGWKMPFANARSSGEPKIRAVPQFFRQPVQAARESPVQTKGLVQTDLSRPPQWQGLVPHMQQKPNQEALRPDLNIGFCSPGSPPARQSLGINLEPQQPDLALQL